MTQNKNSTSCNIITFTSDFGSCDGYVGIVKGSIAIVNPTAKIVDLAHQLTPFDIRSAAWVIYNSYRFFPDGTVHLGVVDPKVGSSQRRILLSNDKHHFVGPDSGIFSLVLKTESNIKAYELKNDIFFLQDISSSFHARDIFGPVAAHLSMGIEPHKFGPEIDVDSLESSFYKPAKMIGKDFEGEAIYIDRFGNLITNIPNAAIPEILSKEVKLKLKDHEITSIQKTYSSVELGSELAFMGSHGYLEIAVNQKSASQKFNATIGDKVYLFN